MFTGITEQTGKIESLEHGADGGRLRVSLAGAPEIAAEMKLGDSIAVNGCCLTVVEFDARISPPIFRAKRCGGLRSAKRSTAIR